MLMSASCILGDLAMPAIYKYICVEKGSFVLNIGRMWLYAREKLWLCKIFIYITMEILCFFTFRFVNLSSL